jgi:endonuclease-3
LAGAEQVAGYTRLLGELYPNAVVELDFKTPFQLLCATILAAQSTDKMINTITPALFAKYPTPRALAEADPAELEPMIFKSGFYRMKAKSLMGMARTLVEQHGGEVPRTLAELVGLPGVARKTANVILGSALGVTEGVVVDTHVTRLSARLGLSRETDPVKIEQDLMRVLPREQWTPFAHRLIWLGRRVCIAQKPDCEHCVLAPLCPSAFAVAAPGKPTPGQRRAAGAKKAKARVRVAPAKKPRA